MGVGAEKVAVTRYLSTSASHSSGSNLRCTTALPPMPMTMPMNPRGPEWYRGPVVRYTSPGW